MTGVPTVVPTERLELSFEHWSWPFASERRAEIDAYFIKLRQERPQIWNGRALLMHQFTVTDGVFAGRYYETDFASFIAWRDWDAPDRSVYNCAPMAAIRCADGAFLLGVQASYTASAGRIYFPAGVPEPADIVDGGRVDLEAMVWRELTEETGLTEADVTAEPGWHTVFGGPRIGQVKTFVARGTGDEMRERILGNLAREQHPELADIRVVHNPGEIQPTMHENSTAFMRYVWDKSA